ncbi:BspA family leucine-rich repeat surface protein, partial [Enterococcus casseliflavus]|nr:BspA family leucine-rich repeat surface protein [Enterococcus casseliflavus]
FNYMYGLEKLDLRSFDTSNVISMVGLFQGMINLKDLYISNFDTSNVISMNYMFSGLWNIRDLEISNFNTSSVVNMNYMFSYLYSVNHLDLTNFNTSNVISMNYMFAESLIKEINLSSFTVSPETTTQGMLIGARYIDTLHLGPYFRFNGTEELRTLSEGEMWKGDVIGKEFSTSEDFMSNFYGTEQADIYRVIPKSIEVKIPVDMIFRSNINDLTILESNQYLIENLSGFSINVKLNSIKNVKNLSSIEYLKINESVLVLDGKENVLEDNFLMTLHANEVRELYFSGQAKEVEKEENPQFTMSMKFIHTDL